PRGVRQPVGARCTDARGRDLLGVFAVCLSVAIGLVVAQGAMGATAHARKPRAHVPRAFEEFTIPASKGQSDKITAGPDGNLWFTAGPANEIGRITPSGVISEFPIPTPRSGPDGIAAGPDGNLWFAEDNGHKIGRITPSGAINEFPIPAPASFPYTI